MDEYDAKLMSFVGNVDITSILNKYSPFKKKLSINKIEEMNLGQLNPRTLEYVLDNIIEEGQGGPRDYDVHISDISKEDLVQVSVHFGYSSSFTMVPCHAGLPVHGIFRGLNRVFFMATLQPYRTVERQRVLCAGICIVPVIVDTCAHWTYLAPDIMKLLFGDGIEQGSVIIYGAHITVYMSHSHFSNVNILGQAALSALGARLSVNYKMGSALMEAAPSV